MAVTRTPAPWRRPARPPRRSRPWAAGRRSRRRARNSPVMTAPRVTSAGKNIPERRPGAAAGRRPRRSDHQPSKGAGGGACVPRGRGPGPGHGQARIRGPAAPACYRYGPGRAGQIGGPAGRSPSGDGIGSGWAEDRGAASARPALGARTAPGGPGPGRQRAVPGTGSRPGLPGCRAGEGGACRAVNMAHTTFPASLGVV